MHYTPHTVGEYTLLLADDAQLLADDSAAPAAWAREHGFAALELRALPCDTPRHFDPVTQTGQAVGGPAVLLRTDLWQVFAGLLRGLAPDAQMRLLSALLRAGGHKMGYCPFFAARAPQRQDTLETYLASLQSEYLLACRLGSAPRRKAARAALLQALRTPRHYPGVRRALALHLPAMLAKGLFQPRSTACTLDEAQKSFDIRGSFPLRPFEQKPLVSIVMRTHSRPAVLHRTLECLQFQTYQNFEVVLIEDGAPTAQGLAALFPSLNIRYHATGTPVGRGRAGNIGLQQCRGEFVCFLDDDDYFYPDHLETHLSFFMQHPECELALSGSAAFEADVRSLFPYEFTVRRITPVLFDHINLLDMCVKCRIPICAAMFRRELFLREGGLREDIGGDEDWAMWLRFWRSAKRLDDTRPDIPRALCFFGVPADAAAAKRREEEYAVFDQLMLSDPSLRYTVQREEYEGWCAQLRRDLAHLDNLGLLDETLRARDASAAWLPEEGPWPRTLTAKQIGGIYHAILCRVVEGGS